MVCVTASIAWGLSYTQKKGYPNPTPLAWLRFLSVSYLQLSYADITFFDLFNNFHSKGKEDVPGEPEKFPLLVEHYKRVLNVPEINEWVKKRPVSEF